MVQQRDRSDRRSFGCPYLKYPGDATMRRDVSGQLTGAQCAVFQFTDGITMLERF
jgi:hypothetical protein